MKYLEHNPMLNPIKNLLAQFFNPVEDHASTFNETHGLQLATAVLLVEVMRSDANSSTTENREREKIMAQSAPFRPGCQRGLSGWGTPVWIGQRFVYSLQARVAARIIGRIG